MFVQLAFVCRVRVCGRSLKLMSLILLNDFFFFVSSVFDNYSLTNPIIDCLSYSNSLCFCYDLGYGSS